MVHEICDEKLLKPFNISINLPSQNFTSVPISDDISGTSPLVVVFFGFHSTYTLLCLSQLHMDVHTPFSRSSPPPPPQYVGKRHLLVQLNFVQILKQGN